jgi:NAD-dependent DNA ligase
MQTIEEKIKQRRRQMLVHSYIYYELDQNIVSDAQWAKWAKELQQLQKDYPEESKKVEEYEQFKDWDGSSGAFLKFGENIKTVAKMLLKYQNSATGISKTIQKVSIPEKKSQNKQLKSNTRRLF